MKENFETVDAYKVGDILYVKAARGKFLPSYVYYLLEYHQCKYVSFDQSAKMYPKEELKGKEDWKDVRYKK